MMETTTKVSEMQIGFTNNDITPFGGVILFLKMAEKCKFEEALINAELPQQKSNRGHAPVLVIKNFIVGLWEGASCFEHLEKLRQDRTMCKILGKEEGVGHRAVMRYLNKFNQATNQKVFKSLYSWFFEQLSFDNDITLDFDSTVIVREGNQDGAAKGYNPKRMGRNSHHPLLAFVADQRFIANYWLRPGNTTALDNYPSFLDDTLSHLGKETKVGLVRMDSGFYSCEVLDILEKKELDYIIACRFSTGIKRNLILEDEWKPIGKGIDIAETEYLGTGYTSPRRIIMVREDPEERPQAAGKQITIVRKDESERHKRGRHKKTDRTSNQRAVQLNLFPEFEEEDENKIKDIEKYRYSCFVTSLPDDAKIVYDKYRGRADCENRIKELKYDFSLDKFVTQNFWATEACGNIITMAYNLFSLFRQAIINSSEEDETQGKSEEEKQEFLKTVRFRLLSIPAYLTRKGNILFLVLAIKRKPKESEKSEKSRIGSRGEFKKLWFKIDDFYLPYPL